MSYSQPVYVDGDWGEVSMAEEPEVYEGIDEEDARGWYVSRPSSVGRPTYIPAPPPVTAHPDYVEPRIRHPQHGGSEVLWVYIASSKSILRAITSNTNLSSLLARRSVMGEEPPGVVPLQVCLFIHNPLSQPDNLANN